MPEKEYASKGVAGTGLGLGIAGTALGLLNDNPGGILNGLFGGGSRMAKEMSEMLAENTRLKSEKYTDSENRQIRSELTDLKVEQARQGEKITFIEKEQALRAEITDGKITQVAQASTDNDRLLKSQIEGLRHVLDEIASPYVAARKVTPLPAPNPFPPVPPYAPYPPFWPWVPGLVPPTSNGGTEAAKTTGENTGS